MEEEKKALQDVVQQNFAVLKSVVGLIGLDTKWLNRFFNSKLTPSIMPPPPTTYK